MRNKISNYIIYSAIGISILCLVLRGTRFQKNSINNQIQKNITQIEQLQEEHSILEEQQLTIHDKAEELRLANKELLNNLYKEGNEDIMDLICDKSPDSPMCGDYKMLNDLKEIAEGKVDYQLLLGIMFSESHIGASFAPHYGCRESKNWAGLKWRKYNDGSISEKYNEQYYGLDTELQGSLSGCYLYYYEDYNQFFESLTNTIKLGYIDKGADTPEEIVKYYVGNYSQNWVDNVNQFIIE